MRRIMSLLACVLLLGMNAASVSADSTFPSDNATNCANAGGVFGTDGANTTTCAVTDSVTPSSVNAAGNTPGFVWVAEINLVTVTTYTTVTTPGSVTISGCINPGGKTIDPSMSDNCNPNKPNRNQKFTILYDTTPATLDQSQVTTQRVVQTGCIKIDVEHSTRESVPYWEFEPNCAPLLMN